jgi:hypothetical protein
MEAFNKNLITQINSRFKQCGDLLAMKRKPLNGLEVRRAFLQIISRLAFLEDSSKQAHLSQNV